MSVQDILNQSLCHRRPIDITGGPSNGHRCTWAGWPYLKCPPTRRIATANPVSVRQSGIIAP